jgi:hypothetical protein
VIPRLRARYRPHPTSDHIARFAVLFLGITGISTWMGTLPGEAAFVLGVVLGWWVIEPALRWVARG